MYYGDKSRKKNLIDYGFRLPSAYGNRPLAFEEFEKYFTHAIFVSATPGEYELKNSQQIVELIIRPTGLLDPIIDIKPTTGQVDDVITEVQKTVLSNARVLVTTLTKRMAEDLTEYLAKVGIKVRYLHSEINSIERTEILRKLRLGEFDVLVGINLLREGLDIPEVALVCVLNADQEGFLRNEKSLIQIMGRAARNASGRVILYANKITNSIKSAVAITEKRRVIQKLYNQTHAITPKTIIKPIAHSKIKLKTLKHIAKNDIPSIIEKIKIEMYQAAEKLNFEHAITLQNELKELESRLEE